jgi:hypothetical protein
MDRLFVIGNGFDIAHGYATRYTDFNKWLISELQQDKEGEIHFTFIPIQEYKKAWGNTDLGERDPRRMLIRMLLHLYDHLPTERNLSWNDFEKALLYIDIEYLHDAQTEDIITEEDGINPKYIESLSRQNSDNLYYALEQIPVLFTEWINTVKVERKTIPFGEKYVNSKKHVARDYYINFNYTETLEQNYNISSHNILHIHGYRKNQETLIIGYARDETRDIKLSTFGGNYKYAHDRLNEALALLRKNTDAIISKNKAFFTQLREANISEIYSYGFSFSKVDLPYVKEIISAVKGGRNILWNISCHNPAHYTIFMETVRKCGFLGEFAVLNS